MTTVATTPVTARSLLVLAALALGGCMADDGRMHGSGGGAEACYAATGSLTTVGIDADQALTATPGDGAGIFIEYQRGGHWHAWVTCDTNKTHQPCPFDVIAQSLGSDLTAARGEGLLVSDGVYQSCSDTVQLQTTTSTNTAGMWFDAPAGMGVRFDAYVDGVRHPELVFWYGSYRNGDASYLHQGAPADPLDIVPNQP